MGISFEKIFRGTGVGLGRELAPKYLVLHGAYILLHFEHFFYIIPHYHVPPVKLLRHTSPHARDA